MPLTDFERLPDDARLWVFGTERPLSEKEEQRLLGEVDAFLEGWAAHGLPLTCAREWRHGRFLLVAVDPASEPPSGCSIDAMVRRLKELEQELGLVLVDASPVWWRGGAGEVRRASRGEFRRLAEEGQVTPETVVWDGAVTHVAQVREGEWERPAGRGWHARAFFRGAASGGR